ncbi:Leucine-rich repeat, immunoglobulin-like domain and transmembrane domain-containing protein 2 [Liparis tanakae]|nr:Leucine-rich repeat, immunoglobulin-like domain and transmembrane domain-containing protein 2 [Liparis tanakae]
MVQHSGVWSKAGAGEKYRKDYDSMSLVCMEEGAFGAIPQNLPDDMTKIRIEKSHFTEIPRGAFSQMPALENLWLNFNDVTVINSKGLQGLGNLTELRLQGNKLRSLPWTAFEDTPALKILDLKHNQLDGFVEFIRSLSPPIILMNSYLTCSGPDFKAGKFFHEVELQTCVKPVVTTPSSNINLPQGVNLTLRCSAKARPDPSLWWTYGLKIIRGFHESQERVDEDTIRSLLVIPSLHAADRGVYTCTAVNFIGNSSVSILLDVHSPDGSRSSVLSENPPPPAASDENVYIDIHIAKQTVRGITIEWYATLDHPAETWFTIHFGLTGNNKKEMIFIGPGIHSYSVSDLMPATKYEICVSLKNQAPRNDQCIVFVTGSDITEMEQREKLIHIVVIVLAMVLAVPMGMYACTTDTKFACLEGIMESWKNRRRERSLSGMEHERQGTFDSLQAASDEGLVNKDSTEDRKVRRRSEDGQPKGKADHSRLTAELLILSSETNAKFTVSCLFIFGFFLGLDATVAETVGTTHCLSPGM